MTPATARLLAWGLTAAVVLAGGKLWLEKRDRDAAARATAAENARTAQATSGIAQDAGRLQEATVWQEVGVAETRVTYHHVYEEARRNDPVVRDWADAPVPQRLRDLARERREERERLGCSGAGCGGDGTAPQP